MGLLNRLTIKNLKLNRNRTIVTIIGIMLSVALLTAVASMFFSARESLIQYETEKKGNYHFSFYELTPEQAEEISLNRKVEQSYLTSTLGYARLEEIQNPDKPYVFVKSMTTGAMENLGIQLQEGRLPENENEILLPTHLKTNGRVDIKVGETIRLDVGNRCLAEDGTALNQNNPYFGDGAETLTDTETKEYTVVGIISRLATEMEGYSAPGYTAVTYMDENVLADSMDIYVRYTKDGLKDPYGVAAEILGIDPEAFRIINSDGVMGLSEQEREEIFQKTSDPKYGYGYNYYLIQLETGIVRDSTLASLGTACILVVVIIIFTSVFCIKNSFDISITEKIRQYGMLSSVGATRKQIKRNVYFEALILGVIGVPLGLVLGHLASFILLRVSNYFLAGDMNVVLRFSFSPMAILLAVILGFLTLFLASGQSARKASRISPIQAIRNSENIQFKAKNVRSPKLVCRLFGIGGEIAYKNLKRSKKKYRTTVVSITICVAVFVALSSFVKLGYEVIKTEFTAAEYNVSVGYKNTEDNFDRAEQVRSLDGIKQISIVVTSDMDMKNGEFTKDYLKYSNTQNDQTGLSEEEDRDRVLLYMLDEQSFREYAQSLNLNYEKVKDQGIIVNQIFWNVQDEDGKETTMQLDKYQIKKGDMIQGVIRTYTEESDDPVFLDMNVEVAAVTEKLPFGTYQNMGEAVLVVSEAYSDIVFDRDQYTMIYILAEDPDKMQDETEEMFKDMNVNIYNVAENARTMQSLITLVGIFLYGFIIVISLIGVTNIFNTITTNMNLRRREFAMLKSVGMTQREFNRMIQLESFFYGAKSLIIGIPVGIVLSYVLYYIMMEGDLVLAYQVPILAIIISVVAVFVLIACIMGFSVRKIGKQNIIETIRNENI